MENTASARQSWSQEICGLKKHAGRPPDIRPRDARVAGFTDEVFRARFQGFDGFKVFHGKLAYPGYRKF